MDKAESGVVMAKGAGLWLKLKGVKDGAMAKAKARIWLMGRG